MSVFWLSVYLFFCVCLSVCLYLKLCRTFPLGQMLEENGVKFYLSAGVKELVGEEGKVRIAADASLHR